MDDKIIKYDNILDGQTEIPERSDKKLSGSDSHLIKDLTILLTIRDIYNGIDNFIEAQRNRADALDEQLKYTYGEWDKRNDDAYLQIRSKAVLENVKREKEITLTDEKDKINILMDIKKKCLPINKLIFVDEDEITVSCLSVVIWSMDIGDDDEASCVRVHPEFVLNIAWDMTPPKEDDVYREIDLDQIQEIIINDIKYTFVS